MSSGWEAAGSNDAIYPLTFRHRYDLLPPDFPGVRLSPPRSRTFDLIKAVVGGGSGEVSEELFRLPCRAPVAMPDPAARDMRNHADDPGSGENQWT